MSRNFGAARARAEAVDDAYARARRPDRIVRYVVIFANPFTGQLIEVHSPSVRLKYLFKDLESDMCPGALKLGFSNEADEQLVGVERRLYQETRGGFADLILVRVSQPSSDLQLDQGSSARACTRASVSHVLKLRAPPPSHTRRRVGDSLTKRAGRRL